MFTLRPLTEQVAVVHELPRAKGDGAKFSRNTTVSSRRSSRPIRFSAVSPARSTPPRRPAGTALGHVRVVEPHLLLRGELDRVVGELAPLLAVLAGRVLAARERVLRAAPQVHAEPAADLVLRLDTLRHRPSTGTRDK
jgi:hypothetical protein